jgi:hypothetical protein
VRLWTEWSVASISYVARPRARRLLPLPRPPRDISLPRLPINILQDQKNIWLFPVQLAKGRHWLPTVAVAGTTAALIVADPYVEPAFNRTTAFRGFNRVFSSQITSNGIIAVPTALYIIGLASRDSYMQKTALFAGEAVFDSEVIREAMNSLTTRLNPSDVASQKIYSDAFFRSRIHRRQQFPVGTRSRPFRLPPLLHAATASVGGSREPRMA